MYRFIVRLLAALLPVRSWRRAFRKKMHKSAFTNMESVFAEIRAKRDTVLKSADDCRVIVLGSSHGAYGVNPMFMGKEYFNLCSNSQDLYTAEYLFRYYENRLPNLKQVVVLLDAFSRGWQLELTSAIHICAAYNYLYGIQYPKCKTLKTLLKRCRKLDALDPTVTVNYNGYLEPPSLELADTVADRVESHLKNYHREDSQYVYLENIIRHCNGCQIVILIPPVRSDYRQLLPKDLLLTDARKLTEGTGARVLDLQSDAAFSDDCFYDYDHLNPKGAEKLSRRLKSLL